MNLYITLQKSLRRNSRLKEISWILSDYNYGVGEMIPKFLVEVLYNELILEHNFVLSNHKLINYRNQKLVKQDRLLTSLYNTIRL